MRRGGLVLRGAQNSPGWPGKQKLLLISSRCLYHIPGTASNSKQSDRCLYLPARISGWTKIQNSPPDVSSYLGEIPTYLDDGASQSTNRITRTLRQMSLLTLRNICMMVLAIQSGTVQEFSARCLCLPWGISAWWCWPFHWKQFQNFPPDVSAYLEEYLYDEARHSTRNNAKTLPQISLLTWGIFAWWSWPMAILLDTVPELSDRCHCLPWGISVWWCWPFHWKHLPSPLGSPSLHSLSLCSNLLGPFA